MIQFDKDGVTLFYFDAIGQRVAKNYMEGQLYTDMLTIRTAQIAAITENNQVSSCIKKFLNLILILYSTSDGYRNGNIFTYSFYYT